MADKQAQLLAQNDQLKVLRIGMVREGKVVEERMIRAGESVTIGEAGKSTFPLTSKVLPKNFVLFQGDKKGQYTLNFVEKMEGKISIGDGVKGLDELRKGGQAKGKGGTWSVPLTDKNRGRVQVEDVTFLFQFVPAPLESTWVKARPQAFKLLLEGAQGYTALYQFNPEAARAELASPPP